MSHDTFAIGCAAGFGGDRTDAAAPIVETLIARGGAGALIVIPIVAALVRAL